MNLDIHAIRPYLLLECISGSKAYGLDTETSDTDLKGVFYLPKAMWLRGEYVAQVSNDTNDEVYYELGRFIELLCESNPSMLELLHAPSETILYRHAIMDQLKNDWFVSQECQERFAGYAMGQLKKAIGLNKKALNPMSHEKKSLWSFCYVLMDGQSMALPDWLAKNQYAKENIGLSKVAHARDIYAMYHGENMGFLGIENGPNAKELTTSSIPKGMPCVGYLSMNLDGFSSYCKEYQSYWQWMKERNSSRYASNQTGYDCKNMMHTFRLLQSALHIGKTGQVQVRSEAREALLAIKSGQYAYDELMSQAQDLMQQVALAFENSVLPQDIERETAKNALADMRSILYNMG